MSETICKTLRDGGLEGEHAPTLTIKDSIGSPFGSHVFDHVLAQLSTNILAGKSQSKGLVLVAFSRRPSFYLELLKRSGIDVVSSHGWIHILDCYTDPLGWRDRIVGSRNFTDPSKEASVSITLCKDVRNTDRLLASIIELGKGLAGQGKGRFSVSLDSVDEILRHSSLPSLAGLISSLRGHEQVSSIFCLLHSDLHEVKVTNVLEYISSIVASLEPSYQYERRQISDPENVAMIEQNYRKGRFHARLKRRNGRVRVMCEEFTVEQSNIKFTPLSSIDRIVNQGLLPKVQFNLELSEKEKIDRANVVLPFEHQGNGKPVQIYDGRRSRAESKDGEPYSTGRLQTKEDSNKGEIIYFRDSDDEMPDSDEDPDDDLDI